MRFVARELEGETGLAAHHVEMAGARSWHAWDALPEPRFGPVAELVATGWEPWVFCGHACNECIAAGRGTRTSQSVSSRVALFRAARSPVRRPDSSFRTHGFDREQLTPSGKSRPVDVEAPIAFAFRLRRLLGIGTRAEAARVLLTIRAPRVQAQTITASAGFAARNVREGLSQLVDARVVDESFVGGEHWYSVDHGRWAGLLDLQAPALPFYDDWPQLLRAVRAILLWLHDPAMSELSPYLRASAARTLVEDISPDPRYARITPQGTSATGEAYWNHFVSTVRSAVERVGHL